MLGSRIYRNVLAVAALLGLSAKSMPMAAPTVPHAPSLPKAPTRPRAERQKPRRRRVRGSSSFKRNGVQECARRVRQIAAGILTVSNGLVIPRGAASAEWRRNVYNYGTPTRV